MCHHDARAVADARGRPGVDTPRARPPPARPFAPPSLASRARAQADCGPFGCNLFVFHIPNDLTNLHLYQLFRPFGNVISVRIMIEHGTGRSRGFGFV